MCALSLALTTCSRKKVERSLFFFRFLYAGINEELKRRHLFRRGSDRENKSVLMITCYHRARILSSFYVCPPSPVSRSGINFWVKTVSHSNIVQNNRFMTTKTSWKVRKITSLLYTGVIRPYQGALRFNALYLIPYILGL